MIAHPRLSHEKGKQKQKINCNNNGILNLAGKMYNICGTVVWVVKLIII